jgi:hypothetical protein
VVSGAPQDVVDSLCDLDVKVAETLAGAWHAGVAANARLTAVFQPISAVHCDEREPFYFQ